MSVRTRATHTRPARSRPARTPSGRTRSMRLTLAGLLAIPLVSLMALWGFAASITLSNAFYEHRYSVQTTAVTQKVADLSIAVTQERLETYIWLSTGRHSPVAPVDKARHVTDAAVIAGAPR